MKRRRKKTKKFVNKKRIAILSISLAVIIIAFVAVMGIGSFFTGFESYEDAEVVEIDKNTGKVNALLVGVDKGGMLTDTIMVASYDMDKNEVNILSIPRDTRMYVGSRYQKINSAHSLSKNGKKKGINGTIEAVTRLTGIPINYYVEFTFSAFRETIDALGGVEFDVPQNMNYDDPAQNLHIHLKKGLQVLDGEKAEQFVRFRRYPMGDIDRVKAQQAFVKAVVDQKLNASIIGNLPELFKALQKNFVTNITVSDVSKYILNLVDLTSENVKLHSLPGYSNGTDYNSSYWIADMTALKTLIETTFGYDASNITIHSADGKSISKDVKLSVPKPTETPEPSEEPTESPEPSKSPNPLSPGGGPEANETQKPSEKPEKEDDDKNGQKPSSKPTKNPEKEPTVKPAEKPEETPGVTATEKPVEPQKPTVKPTEKPAETPTEKPAEKPITRPGANPTTEE